MMKMNTGRSIHTTILIVGILLCTDYLILAQQGIDEVRPLEPGKTIERELAPKAVHIYRISLTLGQIWHGVVDQRGIPMHVYWFAPDGRSLGGFTALNDQGPVPVMIEAKVSGDYHLHVRSLAGEGSPSRYDMKIEEVVTADRAAAWRAANAEIVRNWLAKNVVAIRTVQAGNGFADLQPLKAMIGSARLVALGEANHGTREFAQFKHRMLEFLVSEMGFTVFALEATMPEAFDVNEYVLTGKGNPAEALAGLNFWICDTEEVLEMIQWMRRYNADPQHEKKVKFYGFDLQFVPRAAQVTLAYLRRVDPEQAAASARDLAPLANPFTASDFKRFSKEKKDQSAGSVKALLNRFQERRQDYTTRSTEAEYAIALQHARIVAQHIELCGGGSISAGTVVREHGMAANIAWILQHEGPGTKIVTWAQNAHAANQRRYLWETLASEVRAIGFFFNQGSFRAMEASYPSQEGLRSFTVGPAPEGSLDAMLASAGVPLAVLDLRHVFENRAATEWFFQPHGTRMGGAAWGRQWEDTNGFSPVSVTQRYDALFFVEKITPSTPAEGGERPGDQLLGAPANVDFESGGPGKLPPDWVVPLGVVNFTYQVSLSDENPHGGRQSAMIRRIPGKHYGETFGSLNQQLDATAYRGKRVKLRAFVRTDVDRAGNQAYLWLRVSRPRDGSGIPKGFYDNMGDRPITTSGWHEYEISGEVAADALMIDYGLALVGEGRAWLDDVTIEFN